MHLDLDGHHFARHLMAREKLAAMKHVVNLDPALMQILSRELARGNKISSVRASDDPPGTLEVILNAPFCERYTLTGVRFISENELHYRGDYYISTANSRQDICAPLPSPDSMK
jgi:hypothetical protein